ncbi:LOW QUALITY PROTEIN: hypothetical protein LMJF_35_2725 [Leishmania major strain Friedlin]|uniref:Uncharacterized protein n=1 Tax=Leishmania major TaxID=5664 RepID=E9AF96_LEIMA|nr:LOW QUALITY PROTEIN: hypothetical protein LMJF_35_2725 [Leishmania major strain Friedlin]CBZ12900.1 hypothetical protein LMJF_35_2725 [Leishmania major strain Friedlin]|eukprot:XP_003722666.1 LOW QUALITY PROTEIN: hypothetical protein LMJF_35_2725 [Leishmania major strain Friedlin]
MSKMRATGKERSRGKRPRGAYHTRPRDPAVARWRGPPTVVSPCVLFFRHLRQKRHLCPCRPSCRQPPPVLDHIASQRPACTRRHKKTDDMKIASLETGDAKENACSTPSLATTSTAAGPVLRPPRRMAPPSQDMPQTARAVPQQLAVSALASCCGADPVDRPGGLYKTGYARRDTVVGHIMLREYPKVISGHQKQIVLAVKDEERLASRPTIVTFSVRPTLTASMTQPMHSASPSASPTDRNSAPAPLLPNLGWPSMANSARFGIAAGQTRLSSTISSLHRTLASADAPDWRAFAAERRSSISTSTPTLSPSYCFLVKDAATSSNGNTSWTVPAVAALRLWRTPRLPPSPALPLLPLGPPRYAPYMKRDARPMKPLKSATRIKAQLEAELTLTGAFFTDSGVDRDAAKQRDLRQEMHEDFEALHIMDDTGVEINRALVGNVPLIHRRKQCNRLLGFLRKYSSSESVLRLHDHHWRLNLARAACVHETVRLCAVKGAMPHARQLDPCSKTLFVPTKTVYDISLKQLAAEALFIPPGHPHSLTTYESYLYLLAILPRRSPRRRRIPRRASQT